TYNFEHAACVPQLHLHELTQPDPTNRRSVEDSPADLRNFAHNVIRGDFGQVRRLATRQLVSSADAARRTVLMLVADAPETPVQTEKCILYLFELGANPKAADANGDTAAHLAARRDHLRLLTLLSFDDAKWLRNENGATPLMEAARTGSWKCAKHLLHLLRQRRFNECQEPGNSKRSRLLGLQDREGRTASDLARLSGHSELASYIERRDVAGYGEISGLTDQVSGICGADAAAAEQLCSNFPLAFAGGGGSTETAAAGQGGRLWRGCLEAAIRGSCDLPDKWGQTALMWAAQNSSCSDEALWKQLVQLASALLAAGASANARDLWKSTPLMWAAGIAPPATAAAVGRVLLDSGADWSLKDVDGKTALDWPHIMERANWLSCCV
uniref:ANK_REP_REGION domain-containing protein n=1 Tax=Macrostomum lignano TaxID=282301 RepID=A0A1I8IRW3_9PLAT